MLVLFFDDDHENVDDEDVDCCHDEDNDSTTSNHLFSISLVFCFQILRSRASLYSTLCYSSTFHMSALHFYQYRGTELSGGFSSMWDGLS